MNEFLQYFNHNLINVFKNILSKDKEKRRKQIPNLLTLTRGIFAPVTIIPAVINKHIYLAFALIALCSLTDAFDGWYARKYNAQSEFGAILDAICDKIFILTLAFPLIFIHITWVLAILILEFIIAIINSYSKVKGNDVYSSLTGKVKTVILDTTIALCYLDYIIKIPENFLKSMVVLTNILQLLTIYGYCKLCKTQVDKKKLTKEI